jgi:regulator of sirC expression with transglutaminase-like and TPR domain
VLSLPAFAALAGRSEPRLDLLALALAREFRAVDADGALAELDRLGAELREACGGSPAEEAEECRLLLGERSGFTGNRKEYDHPDNSMLDLVLARRTGLPILLSVVYVEVARRAGIPLAGVGLPGHFVVGHFGADPPLLLDPFSRGRLVRAEAEPDLVRPWGPHETALRMLNNLVRAYSARGDLARAIIAARLRLALPADDASRGLLSAELRALEARLN